MADDNRKRLTTLIISELCDSETIENNFEVLTIPNSSRSKRRSLDEAYILSEKDRKRRRCLDKCKPNDNGPTRVREYMEVVRKYSDCEFFSHFRMPRTVFQVLVDHFGRYLSRNKEMYMPVVPIYKKALAAVWLFGTPESYRSVADRFGMSTGTLHYIAMEWCDAFTSMKDKFICWPSEHEAKTTMNCFEECYGFPGVVGAVDGCHINIKEPVEDKVCYYNRKSRTSILLQGTCDIQMKFIDVCVGWPGSVHDARVWRNSALKKSLDSGAVTISSNGHLIGDSAYPLEVHLMTPFRDNGHLSSEEKIFNRKLSSCRAAIERAFAMLKGKWRRLQYLDMSLIHRITDVITACCVIHNIFLMHSENIDYDFDVCEEDTRTEDICHSVVSVEASVKRRRIAAGLV